MNHADKVHGFFFETSQDAATFLEPTHTTLDDVASLICFFVEGLWSTDFGFLIDLLWDHRLNPMVSQPGKNPWHSICLVGCQLVGATAWPSFGLRDLDRFHEFFEGLGFVNLSCGDFEIQRHAVAIAEQVYFGAQTASGTA